MQLSQTLQTTKILVFLMSILLMTACQSVLKEEDLELKILDIEKPIHLYQAKLHFSSAFGSSNLDVEVNLTNNIIDIAIKDPLEDTVQSLLRYKNNRWAFKDPSTDEDYYFISDKNFLKYLRLDDILPNSSFITYLLKGTFPYSEKVSKKGEASLNIKGKGYQQEIYINNGRAYLINIFDDQKNPIASIEYGNKHVNSNNFYLPLFITITYKKHNLVFSLSVSDFKIKSS